MEPRPSYQFCSRTTQRIRMTDADVIDKRWLIGVLVRGRDRDAVYE